MRKIIDHQQPLVEQGIEHEHAKELAQIDELLLRCPNIAKLVHSDLVRGLKSYELGRPGTMTAEQVLKVLLIKQMNDFSFRRLQFHLADSRTYRSFCQFGSFDKIPSTSAIQRDIKKIQPETMEAINSQLMKMAADKGIEKGRKIRVDCTVVESNIHTPTDSLLLSDCIRKLCHIMANAESQFPIPATNHARTAKKLSLSIMNAKNKEGREEHYKPMIKLATKVVKNGRMVSALLKRIARNSEKSHAAAMAIREELENYMLMAEKVIQQTRRRILHDERVPASEKIVSIFEPHTDVIVKDRRDTYYGHKIVLTNGASGLFTDVVIEEGNPADSTLAKKSVERQKDIYGRVPRQVAFDGGFASKENLADIKDLGVSDVSFSKKRGLKIDDMTKSTWVYKRLRNFRAGIEGMISYLKRCFGLSRCNWRGFQSFKAYVWSSVLSANFLLLARRINEAAPKA